MEIELTPEQQATLDEDLELDQRIREGYRNRRDPESMSALIADCERMVAIAGDVVLLQKFLAELLANDMGDEDDDGLPEHIGFTRLAIIRERQGDYTEAIRLCRLASFQGWAGDWQRRIARCESKLEKVRSRT